MSLHAIERVTHVHHWNDNLFSFRTTRDPGLRFEPWTMRWLVDSSDL